MNSEKEMPEVKFIKRIEQLGTGELSKLRRGCGARDPIEGRCPWFVSVIHGAAKEPTAFLVAGLLAQFKTVDIKAGRHRRDGDFGQTWKRVVELVKSNSVAKRFSVLLDSEFDPLTGEGDLPYRLRRMVLFAVSKGVGTDWVQLLKDMRSWNSENRWVQKKWARSFFSNDHNGEKKVS